PTLLRLFGRRSAPESFPGLRKAACEVSGSDQPLLLKVVGLDVMEELGFFPSSRDELPMVIAVHPVRDDDIAQGYVTPLAGTDAAHGEDAGRQSIDQRCGECGRHAFSHPA